MIIHCKLNLMMKTNTKRIIAVSIFAYCFLLIVNCFSQSPPYPWANAEGGTSFETGNGISTDADGNVLVTGAFLSSSISFGSTILTNASAGGVDIFVAKE
jgi:hypothetical protein